MNLESCHLTHQQLCDLIIAAPQDTALPETHQDHLRNCLICASELKLMRSSIAGFQDASTAFADRELARRPIRPFASIYNAQPGGFINLAFVWATAALVIAAIIPLGLNTRFNPALTPDITVTQSATNTSEAQPDSDAALLEGIDQALSAAIPAPMQPLAGPSTETAAESVSADTQNKN